MPHNFRLSSNLIAAVLIIFYIAQSAIQILNHSVTFDEPLHIKSGIEWLSSGYSLSDPLTPPLSKAPFAVLQLLGFDLLSDPYLILARISLVIITSLFLIYFYSFVKKQISFKVALLSLFFLTVEPAFIAYAHLANTEAITLITFFLVFATGIEFLLNKPNSISFTLFLFSIILLYLSKSIFIPAFIFLYIAVFIHSLKLNNSDIFKSILFAFAFFALLSLVLTGFNPYHVYGAYLNIPGGGILATTLNSISYVTDPAYVETRQIIFNGNLSHEGSIFYTPLSFFLKTSPYLLVLSISFIIYYFWKEKRKSKIVNQMIFIISATILLVILGNYNVGIRHLLPIFPFLAILSSILLVLIFEKFGLISKLIIFSLIFISVYINVATNDKISYFNPIIGNDIGSILISESNLDWGQSLPYLKNNDLNIDYILSYSAAKPTLYGINTPVIPSDWDTNLEIFKGKNLLISHTLYYKSGFYKYDEFNFENAEKLSSGTFLLFKIE